MPLDVAGIKIPDSALAREITEVVRDTASPLLFHHSSRVYYFAALTGQQRGLKCDPELLYCGCMWQYADAQREAVVGAHPRGERFKEDIIQAFDDGIKHKPQTTFGNVKADVIASKEPSFVPMNFCSIIRNSQWRS